MRMRWSIGFATLLLLSACTTTSANDPPWIKFNFSSAWTWRGAVHGTISRTGAVTIEARRWLDGRRVAFERQLRPNELGRLQQAIAEHRTRFGADATIRPSMMDAGGFNIVVVEGGQQTLSFVLTGPCWGDPNDPQEVALWNELMHATRGPDYDMLDHTFRCTASG